jgi:AraC-like DNA-binding protein
MRHIVNLSALHSIVAYANHATIAPGKTSGEFLVMSRMLLWCRAGEGNVTVNDRTSILRPGDMMFMPWGHRIRYFNGSRDPWRISGIHIIPDLPPGSPLEYKVRHRKGEKIIGNELRKDANLGKVLKGVLRGHIVYPSPLSHLAEYTVELFIRGNQTESQSRMIAGLLLQEIEYNILNPVQHTSGFPLPLVKMCDFVNASISRKISLHDLMKAGGISSATACRLFSRHLGMRPFEWINRKRIEKASELLLSTDLRIGEIADRVGIPDLYYFSKLFSKIKGVPAGKFRSDNSSMI